MKKFFMPYALMLWLVFSGCSNAQPKSVDQVKSGGVAVSNAAAVDGNNTEQELRKILLELSEAQIKGDKKVWGQYLGDDFILTDTYGRVIDKESILKNMSPQTSSSMQLQRDLNEMQVMEQGNVAIVNYKYTELWELGGQKDPEQYFRATNTFIKQAAGWKTVAMHISEIPIDKSAIRFDPAVYDSYVGEYELAPNRRLIITREGDKLMGQGNWADQNSK